MSDIFISDLHLSDERPDIYRAFCHFLQNLDDEVKQLYILGDLFEVWIGPDRENELAIKVVAQLRLLAQRKIRVFFQAGNRDFLIGNKFAKAADIELLPDYHLYEYHGRKVLLMHGDLLCTDDKSYLRFRHLVHNPILKSLFRLLPVSTRRKIGIDLRKKSAQGKSTKSAEIMDVNQRTVLRTMEHFQVSEIIHGHTHRPKLHKFGRDHEILKRYVLGDWDKQLWWIVSNAEGIQLCSADIKSQLK